MIKQFIALIIVSVAIVFFMPYAQQGMQLLINAHDGISQLLSDVFSGGQAGNLAKELITLLSIPLLIALIPTLLYWAIRRHWFPYFMEIVWIIWLIQAGGLLVIVRTLSVGQAG